MAEMLGWIRWWYLRPRFDMRREEWGRQGVYRAHLPFWLWDGVRALFKNRFVVPLVVFEPKRTANQILDWAMMLRTRDTSFLVLVCSKRDPTENWRFYSLELDEKPFLDTHSTFSQSR